LAFSCDKETNIKQGCDKLLLLLTNKYCKSYSSSVQVDKIIYRYKGNCHPEKSTQSPNLLTDLAEILRVDYYCDLTVLQENIFGNSTPKGEYKGL